jgi:cobalt-zinc-cadmium efflux system outer membrane protein
LQAQALQQRLDLAAARHHVAALEAQLRTTRRWRLLATTDIGAAGEREADGSRRVGPSLSLALPLFNQGQGAMARASAELDDARAAQRQIELKIGADVSWQSAQLSQASLQVQSYRDALLPARSAVVERLQERVNFMLDDAFTLLQAKQQEYAAHAGLIDATRDYWRARVELSRATGGPLSDEVQP